MALAPNEGEVSSPEEAQRIPGKTVVASVPIPGLRCTPSGPSLAPPDNPGKSSRTKEALTTEKTQIVACIRALTKKVNTASATTD
jgi:hypothetical protein